MHLLILNFTRTELVALIIAFIVGAAGLALDILTLVEQTNFIIVHQTSADVESIRYTEDILELACSETNTRLNGEFIFFEAFDCSVDSKELVSLKEASFLVETSESFKSNNTNMPWFITGIWFFLVGLLLTVKILRA